MEGVKLKSISDRDTLVNLLNLSDFDHWITSQISGVNLDTVTSKMLDSIKGAHPSIRKHTALHLTSWDNVNNPEHFSIALYEIAEGDTIHYDENGVSEVYPEPDGGEVYTLGNRLLVYSREPNPSGESRVRVHYGYIDEIPQDILRRFDE